MTTRELAKHIFKVVSEHNNDKLKSDSDDLQVVNYISHLMELHFEPDNHLGSKGFQSISEVKRESYGC
jgi:hypothetical protein